MISSYRLKCVHACSLASNTRSPRNALRISIERDYSPLCNGIRTDLAITAVHQQLESEAPEAAHNSSFLMLHASRCLLVLPNVQGHNANRGAQSTWSAMTVILRTTIRGLITCDQRCGDCASRDYNTDNYCAPVLQHYYHGFRFGIIRFRFPIGNSD